MVQKNRRVFYDSYLDRSNEFWTLHICQRYYTVFKGTCYIIRTIYNSNIAATMSYKMKVCTIPVVHYLAKTKILKTLSSCFVYAFSDETSRLMKSDPKQIKENMKSMYTFRNICSSSNSFVAWDEISTIFNL